VQYSQLDNKECEVHGGHAVADDLGGGSAEQALPQVGEPASLKTERGREDGDMSLRVRSAAHAQAWQARCCHMLPRACAKQSLTLLRVLFPVINVHVPAMAAPCQRSP